MREIIITPYVIKRYQERTRRWDIGNEQAHKQLMLIAQRGSITRKCPGGCYEMTYNGEAIVIKYEGQKIKIMTFLGNKQLRKWFQKTEIGPRYSRAAM